MKLNIITSTMCVYHRTPMHFFSSPWRRFGGVAVTIHTYGNVLVPAVAYLTPDQMKFYPP